MEASGQFKAPTTLTSGNRSPISFGEEAVSASKLVWTLWSKENPLAF
jgi:hypothetical protein